MAKRRAPAKSKQKKLLDSQGWCCFYCTNSFWSWVYRPNRGLHPLGIAFDHMIPYTFLEENPDTNFVAACDVCNSFKGSKLFDSIKDARDHIAWRWRSKGYRIHGHDPQWWEQWLDLRWLESKQTRDLTTKF